MPAPPVSDLAREYWESLGPWARADEADDRWDLLRLCEAIVGGSMREVDDIIRDTDDDDVPGWSAILDADRAPITWLPWTAQLAGTRLPSGLTEQAQRDRIKTTPSGLRGTPGAIVGAVQSYLTGSKTVYLTERHGSAYLLTVATLASETTHPDLILDAIKEQKPGGIVLSYQVLAGGDYQSLRDSHTDYTDVRDTFVDYAQVAIDPTLT